MKALPEDFETGALIGSLAEGWNFAVESADYAAVGGGSYHWVVTDPHGERGFVTVDHLDRKPWFGDTRELAFAGLTGAFDTAASLRDGGLDFVVAPIRARAGETLLRVGPCYSAALFPFVDGQAGTFGQYKSAERAAIVAMLSELHRATPPATGRRIGLELPGRRELEWALQELDQQWSGGPFSEPARKLLAPHASYVAELLSLFDRLAIEVTSRSTDWVVTHGEPHAANVMRTGESYVLIDWDTVALAPPERDLWMLAEDTEAELTNYGEATEHELDPVAVDFFRLRWDLADIAAFTDVLRSPHRESADTLKAHDALAYYATTRDRWAALLE